MSKVFLSKIHCSKLSDTIQLRDKIFPTREEVLMVGATETKASTTIWKTKLVDTTR